MQKNNPIELENTLKKQYFLHDNWKTFRTTPSQFSTPLDINLDQQPQINAVVPGTIAMAENINQGKEVWEPVTPYDHNDWWYYTTFTTESLPSKKQTLCFDGLATLCEVWLNGQHILTTDNMFRAYRLDIHEYLNTKPQQENQLFLCFRSVNQYLTQKRPRPNWKTKLVDNQQMRWVRETVLGRVNVWTPPITPIGPWRNVYLENNEPYQLTHSQITPQVSEGCPQLSVTIILTDVNYPVEQIALSIDGQSFPLVESDTSSKNTLQFELHQLRLKNLALWWPHTHGSPTLHDYKIELKTKKETYIIKQGKIGFKAIDFVCDDEKTQLSINQQNIFCRGTCWTVSDYFSLNAHPDQIKLHLQSLKNAGINMLRVGGTMLYESDEFYTLCDELGIMIWQDFMFASMDYPVEDPAFLENIKTETRQQLNRFSQNVSISVLCGNTDIEAQAAMFGLPPKLWSNNFFNQWLPKICHLYCPDVPYLSSSPTGGTLPFHLSKGVAHYWGVGAYMHDSTDPNQQRVRFSSEGMGLSHIPEDDTITQFIGKTTLFPYDNDWTKRIPRDLGAGWDFDDIRDKYLEEVFALNANHLKRSNIEKYIQLSKVTTGEVLCRVFRQWRAYSSHCNGGLIWFNRDFWPCAGFGIIDSNDLPKACYFQLKNIWATQLALITNDGLDGASLTLINESSEAINVTVKVSLLKYPNIIVADASKNTTLNAHHKSQLSVDEMLSGFYDTGYAYRFGTPQADFIVSQLITESGELIHQDVLAIHNNHFAPLTTSKVTAQAEAINDTTLKLEIESSDFLQYTQINIKGYLPDSNYFHLIPNQKHIILLHKKQEEHRRFRGELTAINLASVIKITLKEIE